MLISEIIVALESLAPPAFQESYDNAGLIAGFRGQTCTGVLCTLDVTEEVIAEAVRKKCNLVVAHHPILFRPIKKLTGSNYVERTLMAAIRADVAIYAIHTNLDNVLEGVNRRIADRIGLQQLRILDPKKGSLRKLITFVPDGHAEKLRSALFAAGAGQIGNYTEASFNSPGTGTYKAGTAAHPFIGEKGIRHAEPETRVEVIFPAHLEGQILKAMIEAHPYEEVAYDILVLGNADQSTGSGMIGELPEPVTAEEFLRLVKSAFHLQVIRHTRWPDKPVRRVALCGGAGSFLISKALSSNADAFLTADLKYHEFFDAEGKLLLMDIGHFESEQFTIDLLVDYLQGKFPNFAVLKPETKTNPVHYYS